MFAPRPHAPIRIFFAPFDQHDAAWPEDDPDDGEPDLDEVDDDWLLQFNEYWDALLPDDDYEPLPDPGDFWPDQDAA
jgi:hypothetical protein